ncbi:TKL protein kinase [Fonticula alba]|uniref:TKL protein kinase n=1 Tax=Fonticula alba TaxID=691883 RepID=A0A058Z3C0_FONAL|nr:TKL protein kinase [Fonticula alba]KCV67982.1 TKL protein kinase [Fonticula alba]|eukprot:XP_009497549.1 TKL protein kinase [Fonticula alba]
MRPLPLWQRALALLAMPLLVVLLHLSGVSSSNDQTNVYLIPSPRSFGQTNMGFGYYLPNEKMVALDQYYGDYTTYKQSLKLDLFGDMRLGVHFSDDARTMFFYGVSGYTLLLPVPNDLPVLVWLDNRTLGISSSTAVYPYEFFPGQPVSLLRANAHGPLDASVLLRLGNDTLVLMRFQNEVWTRSELPLSATTATPGLPGHFFLTTPGNEWVWLRDNGTWRTISTGDEAVLSLSATRIMTTDPSKMDLLVITPRRMLIYIGLGSNSTWERILDTMLPTDRQDLSAQLIPGVVHTPRPPGFFYLVNRPSQLWRVTPLTGDGMAWQHMGSYTLPVTPIQSMVAMDLSALPGGRGEQWALTHGDKLLMTNEEFGCHTDASIVCDPASGTWGCAPGRRYSPLRTAGELCAGCADGFYPVMVGPRRRECRPCTVDYCRVCADSGHCLACSHGFLLRDPAGGRATCVPACPPGTISSGEENNRLYVSSTSLSTSGPGSLLVVLSSGQLVLGNADQLRVTPLQPLQVAPITGLPTFTFVNGLLESIHVAGRDVQVEIEIRETYSVTRVLLTCTLPGLAPNDECQLAVASGTLSTAVSAEVDIQSASPPGVSSISTADVDSRCMNDDGWHAATGGTLAASVPGLPAKIGRYLAAKHISHGGDAQARTRDITGSGRLIDGISQYTRSSFYTVLDLHDVGHPEYPSALVVVESGTLVVILLSSSVCFRVDFGLDECPPRTYGATCLPCHAACQTCTGPASTQCTSARCTYFLPSLPNNCLAACPAGLHADASGACRCHANCEACHRPDASGPFICTACPPGMALSSGTADRCAPCHSSCLECTAPASATACRACPSGMLLRPDGTCGGTCPPGTWGDTRLGVCTPCSAGCLTCENSYSCTACRPGHLRETTFGMCLRCDPQCAECAGALDACVACTPGMHWVGGVAPSPAGATGACTKCPVGCATCDDHNSKCFTCTAGYLLLAGPGQCVPACPDGMAPDAAQRNCLSCHATCTKCSTPADPSACTACPAGRVLHVDGRCMASCPTGFYPLAGVCTKCGAGCSSCASAGTCAECAPQRFHQGDGSCDLCHASCAACASSTACTACRSGLFFLSPTAQTPSLCSSTCPAGNYAAAGRCQPCAASCVLCAGAADRCQVCAAGHRWRAEPPAVGQTDTCVRCPDNCASCTGDMCLDCEAGFFLTRQGACVTACPAGTWKDQATGSCQPCAASCATCTGPESGKCTACVPGLQHQPGPGGGPGPCVASCPAGQFRHTASQECRACHGSCATCTGPTDRDCLACTGSVLQDGACARACAAGHLAVDDRCLPCHLSCGQCIGLRSTECTESCQARLLPQPAGESPMRCVASCASGFHASSTGCTRCPEGCAACPDDAGHCAQCERSHRLLDGACVPTCPQGTWEDGNRCTACHPSCISCFGPDPTHCDICHADTPLKKDSSCYETCPAGTYEKGNNCMACSSSCAQCLGPGSNECTACPEGRALSAQGMCVGECPVGQFATDGAIGQVCRACSASCRQCDGPDADHCTGCQDDLLLQAGRCVSACTDGFFACHAKRECSVCPTGCATCFTSADRPEGCQAVCTTCRAPWMWSPAAERCVDVCPAGEFQPRTDVFTCEPCAGACASCHGQADRCTVCSDAGAWLHPATGACSLSCSARGLAKSPVERVCLSCPEGCQHCGAPPDIGPCLLTTQGMLECPELTACDRCDAEHPLLLGDECVAACRPGFYAEWDADPPVCRACHQKCAGACTGPEPTDCRAPDKALPSDQRLALGLGISLGALLLLLLLLLGVFLLLRWRRAGRTRKPLDRPDENATILNTFVELSLPGAILVDIAADFVPLQDQTLGQGGQASVFAARAVGANISARTGCPDVVAIKKMKADKMRPLEVTLFQNEIALMLLRGQDHIVRIYGYSEAPPAIVMEHFQSDLSGLLHSAADLPLGVLLDLVHQWAAGLEAMHAQGVAHCDLKPANVFVRPRADGYWSAALGDLGTSRNLSADRASALLQAAPQLNALTARYAAPEVVQAFQARRALALEAYLPADIYSAAIMLWECLARAVPWKGLPFARIAEQVLAGDRPEVHLATSPIAWTSQPLAQGLVELLPRLWNADMHARPGAANLRHSIATLGAMLPP